VADAGCKWCAPSPRIGSAIFLFQFAGSRVACVVYQVGHVGMGKTEWGGCCTLDKLARDSLTAQVHDDVAT
jgi:hypothetical protein